MPKNRQRELKIVMQLVGQLFSLIFALPLRVSIFTPSFTVFFSAADNGFITLINEQRRILIQRPLSYEAALIEVARLFAKEGKGQIDTARVQLLIVLKGNWTELVTSSWSRVGSDDDEEVMVRLAYLPFAKKVVPVASAVTNPILPPTSSRTPKTSMPTPSQTSKRSAPDLCDKSNVCFEWFAHARMDLMGDEEQTKFLSGVMKM
jgi:hypothetical protein